MHLEQRVLAPIRIMKFAFDLNGSSAELLIIYVNIRLCLHDAVLCIRIKHHGVVVRHQAT